MVSSVKQQRLKRGTPVPAMRREHAALGCPGSEIYLDHQATTPVDPEVLEAMLPWFQGIGGNPHSQTHAVGRRAAAAVEYARQQVAGLMGVSPEGIVFTGSGTEATNLALQGYLKAGDHVIISAIEHASVRKPLNAMAKRGCTLDQVAVDAEGLVDLEMLGDMISAGARFVSIQTVNSEIGTVQPIGEIASICRQAGVPLHTDAVQALGKIPLSVEAHGIAMASVSAHKLYGPQGIGALYVAPEHRRALSPLILGGGQQDGLRSGTLSTALCVGFGHACSLASRSMDEDARHSRMLLDRLVDRLRAALNGWHLNGNRSMRIAQNASLTFEGVEADALLARLPDIALSTGSACSSGAIAQSPVLEAIGLPLELSRGTIRLGTGRFTTVEELDYAVDRVVAEVTRLRGQDASSLVEGMPRA